MNTFTRNLTSVALASGVALAGSAAASAEEYPSKEEIRSQYSEILYEYFHA